ncbi:MAG: DNA polymerase III subunit alpha [Proteobacteria bacterium]|nr:DNA polymerase III subunit alpha [Pseudomonadota bacterium]MDA1135526.1 DNA polymerase III subunit alpha [Pseudomonadota bacterium]
MKQNFIHLRNHSNFSLAEGMLSFDYLSKFCIENFQPAIAITDTSNMFGVLEFSLKMVSLGIQPIIGIQVQIAESSFDEINVGEVVLIAKNEKGYKNLLKISSNFTTNSEFERIVSYNNLKKHHDGLILLTGGVEKGFIGNPASIANSKLVYTRLKLLQEIFNDNLYIEIQRHGMSTEDVSEPILLNAAKDLNLPIVATNDCYFQSPDKYYSHQILTCIDKGLTISSPNRRVLTREHYLKSTDQMTELFKDLPEAIENTIVIAKRSSFSVKGHEPILPRFPDLDNITENNYLIKISLEGIEKRFQMSLEKFSSDKKSLYNDRLKNELDIINNMGFSGYFLIVYDFIKWSKDNNIPVGPGRGSGAGSIVAWALEITDLDPIKWGLLFERFLNPERVSMPDFDIDFCQDRRGEVIDYVRNRYGHDRVAQIITFGSLQAKAAIRDVGRVMEMPYGHVDKIAKLIPLIPANPLTIQEAINSEELLRKEMSDNDQVKSLLSTAIDLEGLNRHVSTHAAGLVIGDRPLNELVPLYKLNDEEMPATQFNMKFVEKAGLVKFDFLGLKTLTVLSKAESLIKKKQENFNLSNILLNDVKTYEMLSTGDTVGVFQLESAGMRDVLIGLKPDRFEDIIAVVSLYRPGPMENIPTYINRKHGNENITYMHADLEEVLKETYGIFIYQEQVLRAAQVLANFSLGSADILRRAMGKKDKDEMFQQKNAFLKGALHKGIDENKAKKIFDQISAFAGYGFNKSHAAAYALIAYQTAWIKCNFPKEFFASMMSIEFNNSEKLSVFYHDLKRLNIALKPPCINNSKNYFSIENIDNKDPFIRYSLSSLKNVGNEAIIKIIQARNEKGFFKNMDDFFHKVPHNSIGKKALESLIKSGAFDCLENNRNKLFSSIDLMLNYSQAIQKDMISNQENLFNNIDNNELMIDIPELLEWTFLEKLNNEFTSLGIYLSSHPLDNFSIVMKNLKIINSSQLLENFKNNFEKKIIQLCGLIFKVQKRQSPRGKWATIQLNDLGGNCEIVLYSDILEKYEFLLNESKPILIDAEIKREDNQGIRIIAKRLRKFDEYMTNTKFNIIITIVDLTVVEKIKSTLTFFKKGASSVFFKLYVDKKIIEIKAIENVKFSEEFLNQISHIKGISKISYL